MMQGKNPGFYSEHVKAHLLSAEKKPAVTVSAEVKYNTDGGGYTMFDIL